MLNITSLFYTDVFLKTYSDNLNSTSLLLVFEKCSDLTIQDETTELNNLGNRNHDHLLVQMWLLNQVSHQLKQMTHHWKQVPQQLISGTTVRINRWHLCIPLAQVKDLILQWFLLSH